MSPKILLAAGMSEKKGVNVLRDISTPKSRQWTAERNSPNQEGWDKSKFMAKTVKFKLSIPTATIHALLMVDHNR